MKCPSCANEIQDSAAYCPACGTPVDVDSTPTMTTVGTRGISPRPSSPPRSQQSTKHSSQASSRSGEQGHYVAGETLAGRYRIVALLGKGGMGEVYRAEDLRLGQNVALKFLPLSMAQDEGARARFHQEVRLAREVSHPNICRVFDIGEVDGRLFLTMEYVDGEDLASLLRRIGQFPQSKALEVARQMCAGIAAAHAHGVLHRDLKPANIMLDGRGRVRITDFGLASFADNLDAAELSSGTPAYMSPEQLAGTEVTPRSDIYSLGLVLYEIFTGKKAFDAATLPEMLRLREKSAPSSPASIVRDIDPLVERVILRCLEKDPAKRPATAVQVAAALPGGDPLAAALAAGETPSPEMVAAAGEKEGMRPKFAWTCLFLTVLGLLAVALLEEKLTIFNLIPLPSPPEVLAAKASEIVGQAGYHSPPTDHAYGFGRLTGYVDYVREHDASVTRWRNLGTGIPPALAFWYRQSPGYLESDQFSPSPVIGPDDPPNAISGMCQVFLDPQGRLLKFEAVPPQVDFSNASPTTAADWVPLFAAAGLDVNSFHSSAAQWTPLLTSDARAAWVGTWPGHGNLPLRVEAASYRGTPVYFELISSWTKPDRVAEEHSSAGQTAQYAMFISLWITILLFGIVLAWRNLRTGRADQRGAFRLALFIVLSTWTAGLLFAHHVPTGHEFAVFWIATGWGLIAGSVVWLLYLALESHVRRAWPNSLISWSRLLSGRWRDPLVGRDLLIGILAGVFWVVFSGTARLVTITWLNKTPLPPSTSLDYVQLAGLRFAAADILLNIVIFVFGALAFFMVFFLLKLLTRNDWLAAWIMVAVIGGSNLLGGTVLDAAASALLFAMAMFVLTRYGLLPLTIALVLNNVLRVYPLTSHVSAWYGEPTIFVFTVLLGAAIFSFCTATKGQPILGRLALEE